ncbi:AAA family ATPase [Pseudonocardia sp. H11422]|uniref:AAA family ATPase n=1 Tax=Pseudonocardia sp. H11422 TaxID=2835866 RepID=UPI001BDC80DA|nr:AAA family ATPase [Pseudonocardia sp. H11422]
MLEIRLLSEQRVVGGPASGPARRETADPDRSRPVAGSRAVVDAWQRHRFFEGLARAVLSAGRPTLLVLDDLQWCDQETMAWLAFLLGFAGDAPLLVAATLRSEEVEQNREVSTALRSLRSAGWVPDLTLGPLDPASTGQLAASLLGRAAAPAEQALLYATTGGYPLFVVEAARSLPDQAGSGQPLPTADLQAVLRHRLEQASPAAQEVAGLAAAFGRDFSLDLLSEAGDLEPEVLVGAVDELWRRHILREQHGGHDIGEHGVIIGGPVLYDLADTETVMRWYRDLLPSLPEELSGWIALLTIPPAPPFPEELRGRKSCGIVWCYTGPHDKSAEVLAPVREFGSPLLDGLHEMPFTALQSAFEAFYPRVCSGTGGRTSSTTSPTGRSRCIARTVSSCRPAPPRYTCTPSTGLRRGCPMTRPRSPIAMAAGPE